MFVVKYQGKFGFIKPWTAVRDGLTYSQQFLTPSVIEGIEKKLFPEMLAYPGVIGKILRHKLSYSAIDIQQERTQARGWDKKPKEKRWVRNQSILNRGVMLNPILHLAFADRDSAEIAARQHLCLCRMQKFQRWKKKSLPRLTVSNCVSGNRKILFLSVIIALMIIARCTDAWR